MTPPIFCLGEGAFQKKTNEYLKNFTTTKTKTIFEKKKQSAETRNATCFRKSNLGPKVQRKWGWFSALFREVLMSRKCQGLFWKMPRVFEKPEDFFLGGVRKNVSFAFIISWLWMASLKSWMLRKFSGIFCTKIKWYKSHPVLFWKEPLKNVQTKTNHGIPKESMQSVVCSVRIPNLWQTMGGVVASPRHEFPQNPDKAQLLGSDFLGWTSDCPIWFASCWLLLLFWRKNGWISKWFTQQKGRDFQKTTVNRGLYSYNPQFQHVFSAIYLQGPTL